MKVISPVPMSLAAEMSKSASSAAMELYNRRKNIIVRHYTHTHTDKLGVVLHCCTFRLTTYCAT